MAGSTAPLRASSDPAKLTAAVGGTGPPFHSEISSGRTPARTSDTVSSFWSANAVTSRRSASVLPARVPPTIVTRDPLPNGVSHSIAFSVGSSEPTLRRSVGNAAGRSSKRTLSASSAAGRPLIVSIRMSEAKRSERRGARLGPAIRSPETSSQRLTCAEEM